MKESILNQRSKAFALRIVKLCRYLQNEQKEHVLSKQIVRSGSSIGANLAEAYYAQSEADFVSKLCISRKEAAETIFWLELLRDSNYINDNDAQSMIIECKEIIKMLTASIKTLRNAKH